MKKVRYIFGRIKNMNFKNMFKTIDKIHTLSGKSKVFIFFDMIICALRYQSGYVDYLLFEMWRLNAKERETVLTRGKNNIFVKYYNNKEFNHIFLNKNEFNSVFKDYLNREYIILNGKNKDEFNKFLKGKLVGALFGEEEYLNGYGESKFACKFQAFRTLEEVKKGIDAPERKMLNPGNNNSANTDATFDGNQWTVEDSSDMPF